MALLTAVPASVKGIVIAALAAAAVGGDTFLPGNQRLLVLNGSGSAITYTITTPGLDAYGNAVADITSPSIAAGAYAIFGPFGNDLADPSTGLVKATASLNTSVSVGLIA